MLTGGFDVLGLFAFASPDEWKSAHVKLRQVQFPLSLLFINIFGICFIFIFFDTVKLLVG